VTTHPYSVSLGVGDLAAKLEFDAVEMVNGSPLMGVANGRAVRRLPAHTAWMAWLLLRRREIETRGQGAAPKPGRGKPCPYGSA